MKKLIFLFFVTPILLTGCIAKSGMTVASPIPTPILEAPSKTDVTLKTELVCSVNAGSDIFSADNPDKKGVYISPVNTKRDIKLKIGKSEVLVEGDLVSNYVPTEKWTVVKNTETDLVAYTYQTKPETFKTNFFTLFIDKQTGQGFLNGTSSFMYQNRNLDNFSMYLNCR